MLSRQDTLARYIEVVIMVAVCRCPSQAPLNKRLDNLVDVYRAILEKSVLSSDEIAIQDDKIGRLAIEDLVDHHN
jgi:uncharacterized protein YfkK (UPF0435 family)